MIAAELITRAWRRVDIKLSVNGEMHLLRWRRANLLDEVFFDDRRVATSKGFWSREAIFGFEIDGAGAHGEPVRLLLSIDPDDDWTDFSGEMRPRGVRLETANAQLVALGSLGPDRAEPFRQLYDRAVKALGL